MQWPDKLRCPTWHTTDLKHTQHLKVVIKIPSVLLVIGMTRWQLPQAYLIMGLFGRPLKVAVLCSVWYGSSSVNNIISKKLMRQHPYPITITLAQMLANSILVFPMLMWAGIEQQIKQVPKRLFLKLLLPLAVGKVISLMTSLNSVRRVSVSYTHTVKASMPIFTVFLAKILFQERYSALVYLSLLPIFIGVSIATLTEINFELTGMLNAFVATLILAVLNVCIRRC